MKLSLKILNVKDVSEKYVGWFRDQETVASLITNIVISPLMVKGSM